MGAVTVVDSLVLCEEEVAELSERWHFIHFQNGNSMVYQFFLVCFCFSGSNYYIMPLPDEAVLFIEYVVSVYLGLISQFSWNINCETAQNQCFVSRMLFCRLHISCFIFEILQCRLHSASFIFQIFQCRLHIALMQCAVYISKFRKCKSKIILTPEFTRRVPGVFGLCPT